jgi:Zn-dependent protease with chaperone function
MEAHRALVERLQRRAVDAPMLYRLQLAALAGLGFAVLAGSVVCALGVSVGLVVGLAAIKPALVAHLFKLILVPLIFGYSVLRALWVRIEPPDGHRVVPGQAPLLEAEVERLRRAAGAPPLAGIVIDTALNAAAASVPRMLGLLGHRHFLVLGLPLMQALSGEQMAAVIAHEFGHLGDGHGRFGAWVYRLRLSWFRLLHALEAREAWAAGMFRKFFGWYAPYFNAYSFVLARDNELAADRIAARVSGGGQPLANALVRTSVLGARLHEGFLPAMHATAGHQPRPPELLYREMGAALRQAHPADPQWLERALVRDAGLDDTHPPLRARLAALGAEEIALSEPEHSAAEQWLGPLLPQLEREFSQRWQAEVHADWTVQYQQRQVEREQAAALAQADRTPEQELEYLLLTGHFQPGDQDQTAQLQAAVAQVPEHLQGQLRLGAVLLDRDDPAGIGHLRRAMMLDTGYTGAVLERLYAFHQAQGDQIAADAVEAEFAAWQKQRRALAKRRFTLSAKDRFLHHDLSDAGLAELRLALARAGGLRRAWLVRKALDAGDTGDHFLLLVQWRGLVFSRERALQRVIDAVELPGSLQVFDGADRRRYARSLRKAAGVPVWRRNG